MIKIKGKQKFIFISLDFKKLQKNIKKEQELLSSDGDFNRLIEGNQSSQGNFSLNIIGDRSVFLKKKNLQDLNQKLLMQLMNKQKSEGKDFDNNEIQNKETSILPINFEEYKGIILFFINYHFNN